MTFITIIDVEEKTIRINEMHFRDALSILALVVAEKPVVYEHEPPPHEWMDGGYMLIDRDRRTIVSRQDCFIVGECVPTHLAWNVIDLSL